MKFGLSFEKKNSLNLSQAEAHNARLHATTSQMPKPAWLTTEGHYTIKAWDDEVVEEAKSLAKRKDAVLAIELVFQVGNQSDWREMPDNEHPQGRPKRGNSVKMNALLAGVKAAVENEIGSKRVISINLHTDESTPHVHVVFAPIFGGKLQAKKWLNGTASCAAFREKLYVQVNKHIACEYTKKEPGGQPHDAEKAAGKSRALTSGEVPRLKAENEDLRQQVQTLFSQLKSEQKKALKLRNENDVFTEKVMHKMQALEAENVRLQPAPSLQPEKRPQQAKNDVRSAMQMTMNDRTASLPANFKKPT